MSTSGSKSNEHVAHFLVDIHMEMQAVHDFVTLLYVIHKAVNSEGIKRKMIEELHWLIDGRFLKHKEYFQKNNSLMTVYDFMRKMIDNYFPL